MRSASLVVLGACVSVALGAFCHSKPNPDAQPNQNPVWTGTPVLNRTVPNGKAFIAGPSDAPFWILHVYGTPYEMGYAHGQMMQAEARAMVAETWEYFEEQVEQELNGIPTWLAQDVSDFGLEVALDLTYEWTKNFTGDYFFEELQGLADGAGVDFQTILRIHMIGELTQGDCSMYGAWGKATASTGKTFQLRALDWDVDGPFKNYAAVVVYHPNSGNGHAFANVGFIGWVGALTGQSSAQMGISEIGVAFPDASFGAESRIGVPFTFLLRDILQFDNTYQDAITRITNATRTCDLILGAGDGKASTFRAFQYSHSVATVIADYNLIPVNDTWHPKIPNVVYFGMDWDCPSYNQALAERINFYYGNITAENTIYGITSIVQTGDVHIGIYDLTDNIMYVSFAAAVNQTGPPMAYDRQFTQLPLKTLFAEPAPSTQPNAPVVVSLE